MARTDLGSPREGLDLDARTLRRLEWHEARALAIGGREARDLGDAILLHDPTDPDPFWNRLSGLRLPAADGPFEARLAELLVLFAGLDRRPRFLLSPLHVRPRDLGDRLAGHGFREIGGSRLMVAPADRLTPGAPAAPEGVTVDRPDRLAGPHVLALADEIADLLVTGFEVDRSVRPRVAADLRSSLPAPEVHLIVARVDGTAVAVAKRVTLGGATFLASITTLPTWRRRGLGRLVTSVAVADAVAEGSEWVHLSVEPGNHGAVELYRGLGFEPVGDRAADWLLVDR